MQLFTTEANRKVKNAPALALEVESGDLTEPFPAAVAEKIAPDEVARLWAF